MIPATRIRRTVASQNGRSGSQLIGFPPDVTAVSCGLVNERFVPKLPKMFVSCQSAKLTVITPPQTIARTFTTSPQPPSLNHAA